MKAKQVGKYRDNDGRSLNSELDLPKQPCHICGALCRPFGYILHGKAQVCSKTCDETHKERRWQTCTSPALTVANG